MSGMSAQQWAQSMFGGAALPDERLRKRLVRVGTAMAEQPDASIPQQQGAWHETMAAYRMMHNDRITPQAIQDNAIKRTRQRCAEQSVVLCLHDLTPLDPIHPMSETKLRQHTVLAIDGEATGELYGLLHQRWFHDPRPPHGENRTQRRRRWSRSQVWPEAVEAIGAPDGEGRWITVADREADDFQVFRACQKAGQGFVIRSQHDRRLEGGTTLREMMARQPEAGGLYVDVSRRGEIGLEAPPRRRRSAQKARLARLRVRYTSVTLPPPRNDPRYREGFDVFAVQIVEVDPPADVKPIDWLLLTSEPVNALGDALTIVEWYRRRWLIEEFHKAQKTGCRLEQTQLEDAEAFTRLAAITAVVAVRLLQLRAAADDDRTADSPAIKHVDRLWVEVVCRLIKHDDPETLTMQAFYHAIAKHGGWLGRRSDGRPGWQTLWRGWQRIADYVTGIQLMQSAPP